MGSVLAFAPRSAASSRKQVAGGATAAVIIFPGVRYELTSPKAASEAHADPRVGSKPKPAH